MPTPIVTIDRIDTLACDEVKGVITSLTRVCRIRGLTGVDYTILNTALTQAGVPNYGDKADGDGFEALIVVERSVRMVGDDPQFSDVIITYKQPLEDEASQDLTNPFSVGSIETGQGFGIIYGRMRCCVQQRPINSYYLLDPTTGLPELDAPGVPLKTLITVSHDFTQDEIQTKDSRYAGKVDTQGGEIQVQVPQKTFDFAGQVVTSEPWKLAKLLISSINKTMWLSDPAYTWMCTEVQYQIMTIGLYKFGFQFMNNPDTWVYIPIWTDPETHHPHPEARQGQDFYSIHYHREVDFNSCFGGFFEGFVPTPQ